jgi:hypothetical protein
MENTPLLSTPLSRVEEDVEFSNEVDGPNTWDLFLEECVILIKYSLPVFVFVHTATSRVQLALTSYDTALTCWSIA